MGEWRRERWSGASKARGFRQEPQARSRTLEGSATEVRILPCAPLIDAPEDWRGTGWKGSMRFEGAQRKAVALLGLGLLAGLAWFTLDAGKMRDIVCIILGSFAFRVLLTRKPRTESSEEIL